MPSTAKKKTPANKTTPPAKLLPVVTLDVAKIDPFPLNREATADLAPLVESVRQYGVQQAIRVRPLADRFEIVYGERRWRACKKLGLTTIPAVVAPLSDEEAQAIRVLENAQRKEPHPLEEAESYERLLAMRDAKGKPIHTSDTIAKVAGRSPGHIYNRLKLTALAPEIRKAFYAGKLSVTAAFLIARGVPTTLQPEAWAKIHAYAEDAYDEEVLDDGTLSPRIIASIIERDYSSRLDHAPFNLKDAKLVSAAASCTACPNRSGNQPQLFAADDPKDVCTDLLCFRQKVDAFTGRTKGEVIALGGKVLTEDESRRIFNGGAQLPYNSAWLHLDSPCYDDPERRTWRDLLGDLCPAPTLAFTSQAQPMLLANKQQTLDTLKANGIDLAALRSSATRTSAHAAADATGEDDDLDHDAGVASINDPESSRHAAQIQRTSRQRILATVVAAAELAPADDNRFVQLVYETMLNGGYHNAIIDLVKRRIPKRTKGEHPSTTLVSHVASLTPASLRAVLLELAVSRSAYYLASDKYPSDLARAIELYAVDAAAIEKAVRDELDAKRAARLAKANAIVA